MAEEQAKEKGKQEKKSPKSGGTPKAAPVTEQKPKVPHAAPRLIEQYRKKAVPNLIKRFGFKNVMEVPRLEKIVLNMGVGKATQDSKLLDEAVDNMRQISGQQPVVTRAKKAISNFKLRQGQAIGCRVTLRGYMMYEFFDRFVNLVLPRVRDFRGLPSKSLDGRGNYSMGLKEMIVFHEIDSDKVNRIMGMDIVICTNAGVDDQAVALLEEMGFPFRK